MSHGAFGFCEVVGSYSMLYGTAAYRTSRCQIERGLYVLRYATCVDDTPPVARVTVIEGSLELMPAPGRVAGVLDHPGQALVVMARSRGTFEIGVASPRSSTGPEASFALDLLDDGAGERGDADGAPRARGTESGTTSERQASLPLAILAHVSRRGDLEAGAGEWVAGPSDILPVEGLAIATARRDVTVATRVQTVQSRGQWSRWYGEGEFAGSRQRADPLTAVALALQGDGAADFSLTGEVMHLGAPIRRAEGREMEFTGHEPIVGFRLELKRADEHRTSARAETREADSGRLKIFRARR